MSNPRRIFCGVWWPASMFFAVILIIHSSIPDSKSKFNSSNSADIEETIPLLTLGSKTDSAGTQSDESGEQTDSESSDYNEDEEREVFKDDFPQTERKGSDLSTIPSAQLAGNLTIWVAFSTTMLFAYYQAGNLLSDKIQDTFVLHDDSEISSGQRPSLCRRVLMAGQRPSLCRRVLMAILCLNLIVTDFLFSHAFLDGLADQLHFPGPFKVALLNLLRLFYVFSRISLQLGLPFFKPITMLTVSVSLIFTDVLIPILGEYFGGEDEQGVGGEYFGGEDEQGVGGKFFLVRLAHATMFLLGLLVMCWGTREALVEAGAQM